MYYVGTMSHWLEYKLSSEIIPVRMLPFQSFKNVVHNPFFSTQSVIRMRTWPRTVDYITSVVEKCNMDDDYSIEKSKLCSHEEVNCKAF